MIEVLRALYDAGDTTIVILSGRSEGRDLEVRAITEDWLIRFGVPYHELHMRPYNDHSDDTILKADMLDKLGYEDRVLFVLDDRQKVVDMWRDRGLTCFQVAPGAF